MPGRIADSNDDPFSLFLAPPPDESPDDRAVRLDREAEARRISDEIDDQIRREHALLKKQSVHKMLLLGQSESGASPSRPPRARSDHLTVR